MSSALGTSKLCLFISSLLVAVVGTEDSAVQSRSLQFVPVCMDIEDAISNSSDVYYPLHVEYTEGISHWTSSSTQFSACSVEPGTPEDVANILQVIARNRTPFAVKGGGHIANPGFSSTEGVHITMTRFKDVVYNADSGTADIGAGLVGDDVYEALEQYNVSILGGRVRGVGIAGFTLGGGYSWKTNQYGLAVDAVLGFELVLPNGTVTSVTPSDEDLFFGLRGGFNNFGIVTKFTVRTFPQTEVWGGPVIFTGDQFEKLSSATVNFQNVTDPKASIIMDFNMLIGVPGATLNLFYDGPEPPAGIFDELLSIPYFSRDVSTRSLVSLVRAPPSNIVYGLRGAFQMVSVTNYTESLMKVVLDQLNFVRSNLTSLNDPGIFITHTIEIFSPTLFSHGSDSAYPPRRDEPFNPLHLYYSWPSASQDQYFQDAIRTSAQAIKEAALAEGQDLEDAFLYGNYAIEGTDLEEIYGDNLERLREIKARYDPDNVMGLAGGWKF